MSYTELLPSRFGTIRIVASASHITQITLAGADDTPQTDNPSPLTSHASAQLKAYLSGSLRDFDLPLSFEGHTAFQVSVWKALLSIPYGQTSSYGALARALDNPKAVRAVGTANGRNPIMIAVPCHRIIGSDHSLTGYAHGLPMKRALLEMEGAIPVIPTLF